MKFDELDDRMRAFETAHDQCVPADVFMVARIDGRAFTRLTRERHTFDAPYDIRVRDMMLETTRHLMACGFSVAYAYTQSDEISLLFRRDESAFRRKLRKFDSLLAGEASAKFTSLLGDLAAFDCRISQLPTESNVVDYFRWRQEDAHRNALHGHCYWLLRGQGHSDRAATARHDGQTVVARKQLLSEHGIDFAELPSWQKRGTGLYAVVEDHVGIDPRTGEPRPAKRRRIHTDFELPYGPDYGEFVRAFVAAAVGDERMRPEA